jgi:hypothetical protein
MVSLKPINILVGRNSAGKSTFARTFPLLKQSIETRSSAPILWWGEDVDFGDFQTSVHNRDSEKQISFHFQVDYEGETSQLRRSLFQEDDYPWAIPRDILRDISAQVCSVDFYLGANGDKTVRRRTSINIKDRGSLAIDFEGSGQLAKDVTIDGMRVSDLIDGFSIIFSESNLFSRPTAVKRFRDEGRNLRRILNIQQAVSTAIAEIMKPMVDARTSTETIYLHAQEILRIPGLTGKGLLEASDRSGKVTFQKLFRRFEKNRNEPSFVKIEALAKLYYTFLSLQVVSERLRETFLSTSYLKPVRVRGERFTRAQELEVSEVSPDGSNLPVFLASLNKLQRDDFSQWVTSLFGYGVDVVTGGGQISIVLVQGGFTVNVADTGYGISQILPVLAKTWWSTRRVGRNKTSRESGPLPQVIVMEQPELHLHPAHQARLADVFLDAIARAEGATNPIFIVETHSETLINRLGELIEERPEIKDSVQILVFSDLDRLRSDASLKQSRKMATAKSSQHQEIDITGSTQEVRIDIATFDSDGVLQNWPYGFFGYKS